MSPYIKNFSLTQNSSSLLVPRITTLTNSSKKIFLLNLILILLILMILILYLIEINQITILGFKISELEKKADELKQINKNLKLEKIKLESLNNLQHSLNSLGLVRTEKVEYFKPIEGMALTRK